MRIDKEMKAFDLMFEDPFRFEYLPWLELSIQPRNLRKELKSFFSTFKSRREERENDDENKKNFKNA